MIHCYAVQLELRLQLRDAETRSAASNLRERTMADNRMWHLENAEPPA